MATKALSTSQGEALIFAAASTVVAFIGLFFTWCYWDLRIRIEYAHKHLEATPDSLWWQQELASMQVAAPLLLAMVVAIACFAVGLGVLAVRSWFRRGRRGSNDA